MKENRRRARAIAIAATEKHSRDAWLRLGYMTGFVILSIGLGFALVG
ncbi:hypothetical protein [Gellertiella hungarica]|uniref:Uncharacterized protein n=1 Tax=Gellertiella hungarica TaxID=1572859 RepID=A0A7W6NK42_9HYPH|nr:hypothetical protein [Gellertiella hungarica]MBB4064164.1 hypothetical protein [Gellertiella hungarica]